MAVRRGTSLPELLVALGMLGLIMVVVVALYNTSRDALRKTDAQSDPFRLAAIAEDHLKSELRGARVFCPGPGDTSRLTVYQPDAPESVPRFEPSTSPPRLRLRPEPTVLELVTNGRGSRELVRRGGGRADRKLVDLGPGGRLDLHFRDSTLGDRILPVTILATVYNLDGAATGSYRLETSVPLIETFEDPPPEDDNGSEQPDPGDDPDPDPEV